MTSRALLDRDLSLDWLDSAALLKQIDDPVAARASLAEALSTSSLGAVAQKKTVTSLARSWITPDPQALPLVEWARTRAAETEDRRVLYVGVLLATQPFFADLLNAVGLCSKSGEAITTPDLRKRMKKTWGVRRSVDVATQRGVKTLRSLGVLDGEPSSSISTPGRLALEDPMEAAWLVRCLLLSQDSEAIASDQMPHRPEFFAISMPGYLPKDNPWLSRYSEGAGRTVYSIK